MSSLIIFARFYPHTMVVMKFGGTSVGKPERIKLVTKFDNQPEKDEAMAKLFTIADSIKESGVKLEIAENNTLHDREVRLSNGWVIKIGRGFDIYQKPDDWLHVGANDLDLRPCLETTVDIYRKVRLKE